MKKISIFAAYICLATISETNIIETFVIYVNVSAMVNTDTDEAIASLIQIYDLVDQASRTKVSASPSTELQIAVRSEPFKPGGKPQLTKGEHTLS